MIDFTALQARNKTYSEARGERKIVLPVYDKKKDSLPLRSQFPSAFSWLKAVRDCFESKVVVDKIAVAILFEQLRQGEGLK